MMLGWKKVEIPRLDGGGTLRAYCYDGRLKGTNGSSPALLYLHGGGYVMGGPGLMASTLKKAAAALNCLVLAVDYRVAPETPFPGGMEDNYSALAWLHEHAVELEIDTARIAVIGDSGGGGHSASLAIAVRDRREFNLCFQVLLYPMLDDRTAALENRTATRHVVWTQESNYFGWKSLLGCEPGSSNVPYGAVPARVSDLAGLPPAWIGVGSIDLFYEEDLRYAERLQAAGVEVTLFTQPGGYHGFDLLAAKASQSKAFVSSWMSALSKVFYG
jgi:acetyl esterase/lipase